MGDLCGKGELLLFCGEAGGGEKEGRERGEGEDEKRGAAGGSGKPSVTSNPSPRISPAPAQFYT